MKGSYLGPKFENNYIEKQLKLLNANYKKYSENEIIDRFNDWNKFGKTIIWLVDGNGGVEVDKLSTGNYLLIFQQLWKYKSFMKIYDYFNPQKRED